MFAEASGSSLDPALMCDLVQGCSECVCLSPSKSPWRWQTSGVLPPVPSRLAHLMNLSLLDWKPHPFLLFLFDILINLLALEGRFYLPSSSIK